MITQYELKKEVKYYPLTGNFNQRTGRQLRIGTNKNIVINSKQYSKASLAWFYMTGFYPGSDIMFLDNNNNNFKFDNLSVQSHIFVAIGYGDGKVKISIDDKSIGIYNDFNEAFEIMKKCLKSMISK